MYKIHCSIRFLHSPRRAKIKPPNFLNSKRHNFAAICPLVRNKKLPPDFVRETKEIVPPISAASKLPPVKCTVIQNFYKVFLRAFTSVQFGPL